MRWNLILLILPLATRAFASDGVLEINQTCAVRTGCFSGDTAGFPITINGSAGRSYRLTSDLITGPASFDGIYISASDVGIDLNNFAIVGPLTCSGSPLTCTGAASLSFGVSTGFSGISLKNGSITGMGNYAVYLGEQAEVTNLRVRWSGLGIGTGSASKVSGNTLYQNASNGIETGFASTVLGNTARQNGGKGIFVGNGSTVSDNAADASGGDGINAGSGSTVSGNTASNNGGDGIESLDGSNIQRNSVHSNTGFGLNLGLSTYRGNTIGFNDAGSVNGPDAVNMGENLCDTEFGECP